MPSSVRGFGSAFGVSVAQNRVVTPDRFALFHADVVDTEDVVDRRRVPCALFLDRASRFFALRLARELARIGLDVSLTLAILLRELVGRNGLTVFFDEAPVPVLARQARVNLEDLHRFFRRSSGRVQPLLDAPLDERVTTLPCLVRRQVLLHLRSKGLVVGQRPLLCGDDAQQRERQRNCEQRGTHTRLSCIGIWCLAV